MLSSVPVSHSHTVCFIRKLGLMHYGRLRLTASVVYVTTLTYASTKDQWARRDCPLTSWSKTKPCQFISIQLHRSVRTLIQSSERSLVHSIGAVSDFRCVQIYTLNFLSVNWSLPNFVGESEKDCTQWRCFPIVDISVRCLSYISDFVQSIKIQEGVNAWTSTFNWHNSTPCLKTCHFYF